MLGNFYTLREDGALTCGRRDACKFPHRAILTAPARSGQPFITGTTTFTRTNGTTGTVGDAVLASETSSHTVQQTVAAQADGSKIITIKGFDKDGALAFRHVITESADGHRLSQYDDDGNGAFDRSQTAGNYSLNDSLASRRMASPFALVPCQPAVVPAPVSRQAAVVPIPTPAKSDISIFPVQTWVRKSTRQRIRGCQASRANAGAGGLPLSFDSLPRPNLSLIANCRLG